MLKKLVRYGNSNALVLDKAILELLNIAEGSVVKISTDGKSIILTPHQQTANLPIHETVTSIDALNSAGIKQSINYYKNLDSESKKTLEEEMRLLQKNHMNLFLSLESNEAFQKEAESLRNSSLEDTEKRVMVAQLMEKHVPELSQYPKALQDFDKKCRELSGMKKSDNDIIEEQKQMTDDFKKVFEKYKDVHMKSVAIMNSPEYQHRAQLLTEKYQDNQNSSEFIKEMQQLMAEFCPEIEMMQQELAAIGKKYDQAH